MSHREFRSMLRTSGLDRRTFALLTGVSHTEVSAIADGSVPLASWMEVFFDLYLAAPSAVRADALSRVADEPEWKSIPGFPKYEASEDGKVRRAIAGKRSISKELSLFPGKGGYLAVTLYDENRSHKRLPVHRIIALTFLNKGKTDATNVCHRDGNKTNNHRTNLYWGTPLDNSRDTMLHKLEKKTRGYKNPSGFRAKLVQRVSDMKRAQDNCYGISAG